MSTVRLERSWEASVEDVWDLWTTREGFEAWWGPVGFRVEVQRLEARVGGVLEYDMIAARAEEIAAMKAAGQPLSHKTFGTFIEVAQHRRIVIRHRIDFLPGVAPYDNDTTVEFFVEGTQVRMVVTLSGYHDPAFTEMATAGFTSQLTKVPDALRMRITTAVR
jgi:uncharacterized protein YndB with AHSA1/START domain